MRRIRHLIRLYFDLKAHKKMDNIVDFKIRWSGYTIITKDKEIKYTLKGMKYENNSIRNVW